MFAPMQLYRFYNVFKSSGEPTYNSDNENFHHSKFAWYANRISLADINPKSHYLLAFNLLNPLLYVYLHALNVEFFRMIWSLRCRCLLCSDFITSVIRPCLHMIGLPFLLDIICKSCTKTLRNVNVYTIELWKAVHWHMSWWHALFCLKILNQRVKEIVPFTSFGSVSYQISDYGVHKWKKPVSVVLDRFSYRLLRRSRVVPN